MPTVARVIADQLKACGVDHFFCVTGGDQPLWIALDDVGITIVPCRSEHAAAYAADGYARLTGRPAFVYGQFGPGVASVASGLADAYWAMSPVVSLTSSTRTRSRYRFEYQELDQVPMHAPVTKWAATVPRPDRAAELVRAAIRQAVGVPPGPVHLELPADMLGEEAGDQAVYPLPAFAQLPGPRAGADPATLAGAADLLLRAQRPEIRGRGDGGRGDGGGPGTWAKRAGERVQAWRGEVAKAQASSRPGALHPAAVIAAVRDALEPADILVADTGYMGAWTGALFEVTEAGRHYLRAAGSLGWAFPASIGASLAAPDATVLCVSGDGGIGYHLMELETALRCGAPVVVVVLNNQSLAFEYHDQRWLFDNRIVPQVNDFLDVNYADVAVAAGAGGIRVTQPEQLGPALAKAISAHGPFLVDVLVDKEVHAPVSVFERTVPRAV